MAGQLRTQTSSHRYKEEIRDMGGATEALMKLRQVTFFYKPGRRAVYKLARAVTRVRLAGTDQIGAITKHKGLSR